jgi:hypothetical protein
MQVQSERQIHWRRSPFFFALVPTSSVLFERNSKRTSTSTNDKRIWVYVLHYEILYEHNFEKRGLNILHKKEVSPRKIAARAPRSVWTWFRRDKSLFLLAIELRLACLPAHIIAASLSYPGWFKYNILYYKVPSLFRDILQRCVYLAVAQKRQFFYSWACFNFCGNLFTEPLPSKKLFRAFRRHVTG